MTGAKKLEKKTILACRVVSKFPIAWNLNESGDLSSFVSGRADMFLTKVLEPFLLAIIEGGVGKKFKKSFLFLVFFVVVVPSWTDQKGCSWLECFVCYKIKPQGTGQMT